MRAALAGALIAIFAGAAFAAEWRIGAEEIHFAWSPSPGGPLGYLVSLQRNSDPLRVYSWVNDARVAIPVEIGDQVAIEVRGGRIAADGSYQLGPPSERSERVWVLPPPRLPVAGTLTLHCSECPSLSLRPLSDLPVERGEAPGLPRPWSLVGGGAFAPGIEAMVWHDPQSGAIELWDSETLAPIPGAAIVSEPFTRYVGAADFDGDGGDEAVFFEPSRSRVHVFGLTGGGLERRAELLGPPGAELAALGDFTNDGEIDFVWQFLRYGRMELWHAGAVALGDTAPGLLMPGFLITAGIPFGVLVAGTADYDGDGQRDLAMRRRDGTILVLYLDDGRLDDFVALPRGDADEERAAVGSFDADGVPGAEILLQHRDTGEISLLFPAVADVARRLTLLQPGSDWRVAGVAL